MADFMFQNMAYRATVYRTGTQTAQTEEFMLQNVANRPTVYRTGALSGPGHYLQRIPPAYWTKW